MIPDCWVITEGHAGMENQAKGLAEALGLSYDIKHVTPTALQKMLPPAWWPSPLKGQGLEPPFPKFVITCGRRSVAASMAIRRLSGGATRTIHIQDPHAHPKHFDALVVPEHDRLRGENVIVARGAMHHVTVEKMQAAGARLMPQLESYPHPWIVVLLGGPTKRQAFPDAVTRDLAQKLIQAAQRVNGSLLITPSRRTSAEMIAILRECATQVPTYLWEGTGENPYLGMLGVADAMVVTSDSASMVTEACASGKRVYIYDVPKSGRRIEQFCDGLINDGFAYSFQGAIEPGASASFHATQDVAQVLRQWFK